MPYCSSCGSKIPDDAAYCPKCGTRVASAAVAASSADELKDAFTRMSQELERAFNIAAKEAQEAFQKARSNIQKTMYKEPKICPNCGEKNPATAAFCFKCGNKLPAEEAQPKEEPKEDKQPL